MRRNRNRQPRNHPLNHRRGVTPAVLTPLLVLIVLGAAPAAHASPPTSGNSHGPTDDSLWNVQDSIVIGPPIDSIWRGLCLDPNGIDFWITQGDRSTDVRKRHLITGSTALSWSGHCPGPFGIVRFDDSLCISSHYSNHFDVYDTMGEYVRTITSPLPGLRGVDWDGMNFWATSADSQQVFVMSRTGELLRTLRLQGNTFTGHRNDLAGPHMSRTILAQQCHNGIRQHRLLLVRHSGRRVCRPGNIHSTLCRLSRRNCLRQTSDRGQLRLCRGLSWLLALAGQGPRTDDRDCVSRRPAAGGGKYSSADYPQPLDINRGHFLRSAPVGEASVLKLYDITGKTVATLDNGYHPAGSASYSLLTTHHSLAAGILSARIRSEGDQTREADYSVDSRQQTVDRES